MDKTAEARKEERPTQKKPKNQKKKQKKSRKKAEKSNLKGFRIRSSNVKFGARESNSAKAGSSQHVGAHSAHSQNAVSRWERRRAAGQNRAEFPNCPGHSPQASYFLSFIYLQEFFLIKLFQKESCLVPVLFSPNG
jgi:hypothetical protein